MHVCLRGEVALHGAAERARTLHVLVPRGVDQKQRQLDLQYDLVSFMLPMVSSYDVVSAVSPKSSSGLGVGVGVGVSIAVIIVVIAVVLFFVLRRRKAAAIGFASEDHGAEFESMEGLSGSSLVCTIILGQGS